MFNSRRNLLIRIIAQCCMGGLALADVTSGLVAHWRMDETSGLVAFDSGTNNHHALLVNFPAGDSQWTDGRTNGGLRFNAATNNQRAIIDDSAGTLNFGAKTNPAFSIALWAKGAPGQQSPGAGVIAKGIGRGKEQFAIDAYANAFRFFVRNSAGASFLASGPTVDGSWQYLVATYDGANTNYGLKLYYNGELFSAVHAPATLTNTTHEISLGMREDNASSGYNLPFYGILDDVRLYDRVLTAAEAEDLYAPFAPPPVDESEYVSLRLLWRDMLNGGTNLSPTDPDVMSRLAKLNASAQTLWSSMDKTLTRTFLWSDLPNLGTDSGHLWFTYDRLKTLALAFGTTGSDLQNNTVLHADLVSALDWMYENFYNETKTRPGNQNWWHWQIGVPLRLNDITILLYDTLTDTQISHYMAAIDKFTPSPSGTAANLVWMATVVAVRGVITGESAKISSAASSLSSVFPYVSSGDGFYRDGSFIQHSYYPYTGSYGSSLLVHLAPLLRMLNGSRWAVTDPQMTNVFQWVYSAYQPVIYRGAMMDMARGRAISRESETDRIIGHQTIGAVLWLAQFAPPGDAAAFKGMVKEWILSDTSRNFCATTELGAIPPAKAILGDLSIPASGEPARHCNFGSMDRVVHLRPGFSFALSMSSSRVANFESFSSENLRGWYTAEGMTYLYNADLPQYTDGFWPTVDSYRLPGTTVDTRVRTEGSGAGYRSSRNWVGGVTLGQWGGAGMQLDAWNCTLEAKKSWFMFDDEIVCLGAEIRSSDNRVIETIIDNRMLSGAGTNMLNVNGTMKPISGVWSETMPGVSWAHLAGNVPGADIGYYFPEAATIQGLREARSGSWDDIDHYYENSTSTFTRRYCTLWMDHGANPSNASYAYVLLPGKPAQQVAAYAASPQIDVLQNSGLVQAVREGPLGLTTANFWDGGSAAGISVDHKAAVAVQRTETNLIVAVTDPTQTNDTGILVSLEAKVDQVLDLDPGISIIQLTPTLLFRVNTAGAGGKSFQASFDSPVRNYMDFQNVHFTQSQLAQPGLSGPLADPDGDGQPNLLEYALLLNPWSTDCPNIQPGLEEGRFYLSYRRRKLASDLAYTIQISTDLLTWDSSEAQLEEEILAETSTTRTIKIIDTCSPNSQTTRFYRLRVQLLP